MSADGSVVGDLRPAGPARVEVWLVDLDRCAAALLAEEASCPRLAAANAGLSGQRRIAHIALRVVIERWAGPDLRRVPFLVAVGGRPSLPGGAPVFSLSHTRGQALVAVGSDGPIGVDLELPRAVRMSDDHQGALRRAASALCPGGAVPADDTDGFLRAWTRLEAVAKADGRGMAWLLSRLGVRGRGEPTAAGDVEARALDVLAEIDVAVRDLCVPQGWAALAAAERARVAVAEMPATPDGLARFVSSSPEA